jgi:hypothetical protein
VRHVEKIGDALAWLMGLTINLVGRQRVTMDLDRMHPSQRAWHEMFRAERDEARGRQQDRIPV